MVQRARQEFSQLAQSNPKKPLKKRIAESCAIGAGVALAMSTGIYMGWNARADRIPQFNEVQPLEVDQIIDVAKDRKSTRLNSSH